MGSIFSSALGIAGFIAVVVGIIMVIIGIALLFTTPTGTPQPWWVWFLLIGGIILGVLGVLLLIAGLNNEPAIPATKTVYVQAPAAVPVVTPAPNRMTLVDPGRPAEPAKYADYDQCGRFLGYVTGPPVATASPPYVVTPQPVVTAPVAVAAPVTTNPQYVITPQPAAAATRTEYVSVPINVTPAPAVPVAASKTEYVSVPVNVTPAAAANTYTIQPLPVIRT